MHLQEHYYLPPLASKGVTKAYLQKAMAKSVLLVDRQRMARFLADLAPSQLAKVEFCSKIEMYTKLEKLLAEQKLKPLGFADGVIPDGAWLQHIVRFIDPQNLCGMFRTSLKPVVRSDTYSEKLYQVQTKVVRNLLGQSDLGKRSPVKRCIEELHRSYRKAVSRLATHAAVTRYKEKLEKQHDEDGRELDQMLENATAIVHHLIHQQRREEQEGEGQVLPEKEEIRDALKLAYTVDSVLRRDDEAGQLAGRFASQEA